MFGHDRARQRKTVGAKMLLLLVVAEMKGLGGTLVLIWLTVLKWGSGDEEDIAIIMPPTADDTNIEIENIAFPVDPWIPSDNHTKVIEDLLSGIVFTNGVHTTPTIEWTDSNNLISCKGRPDGYYADTTDSQNSFFRCKDSLVVEKVKCEKGTHYDPHTQQCSLATALDTDCDQSDESFYTMPGTLCRGYYHCRNGTREDFTCPKDSYFDMNFQYCVRTGGLCYELVCSGRVNGRYADTTHECRRSYVCEGGVLRSLGSCPAGTLYNGSSCQPTDQVKCMTSEKSAVAVKILPTDPCAEMPNGFQTLPDETCRNYLLCHSGQTIAKLRCAPGDHFNGVKCAPATNTSCASYCADKPDGFTTDLRRQCRGYVSCLDGRVVEELACKDGSLFNGKTCVPALLYQCPLPVKKNICSNLKDGYHQDYMTGCKEYFYCHQGQMLLRSTCRDGKVWNGSDCVGKDEFLCDGPQDWPACTGLEDGLYPDLSKNSKCKFYQYCSDGKRVQLRCPRGLVFNGKYCVDRDSYHCPELDRDCNNKEDGYYSDPKSGCRSYFYCSNGQKLTFICPEGLVFNGTECVDEHFHNCTSKTNICINKTNGYHADVATGCHKYVYCLQKVKITSFECSENGVFDGKKCVPFNADNCPKITESCEDAEDGLYSEPNSQCTRYFKCIGKKKTSTYTCREGKVFNGVKCVKYICPVVSEQMVRRDDCVGKIGFFQDFESDCNKYYFCINGVKTMLSCKKGQVFNGEVCVSEKDYPCPT